MHIEDATSLSASTDRVEENSAMAKTKQTTKRSRAKKALPVLGLAGVSLAMAGGASASTPTADTPSQNTTPNQQLFLGEEELSDVSLSTFYVFDKENAEKQPLAGQKTAWWGGCRCGGCRCGGCAWRGCAGCGGCGGCCWSWGRCRAGC
jgi:hypothetical protein